MKRMLAVLSAALLLFPAVAMAEQGRGIELITKAEVEVKQGDSVIRVLTDKANVAPDDVVIYTITYSHSGDQPATDVIITNPLPEQMTYIDKSAEGAGTRIAFSIDQGKTYAPIENLVVKNKAGRERPARAGDINAISWTLEKPIPPGGKGSVSYRAKVK